MVDIREAVELHGFASARAPRPHRTHGELLAPGVVHVDYDDPDHVFRITVEEIPRRHLPVPPTAASRLDDIDVRVTDLITDTHLSVRLEGHGAAADAAAAAAEHRRALDEWAATQSSQPDRRVPPPTWPAARLRTDVHLVVGDDVGTDYRFASGEEGGDESPWGVLRRYLPAPRRAPPHCSCVSSSRAVPTSRSRWR